MQKWEYKFISSAFPNENTMNQLGAEGWELVSVNEYKMFFKRPKR
jgi:hypothetical protein